MTLGLDWDMVVQMSMISDQHHHLIWRELNRKPLLEAPIFQVFLSRRQAADGKEGDYVLVDSPDWCNVVAPVTGEDGRDYFVMARQYRQGSRSVSVEFPGGLVDGGESPEAAALRELQEETGYTASRLILIGRTNPNPAFMTNAQFTYLAEGVRPDRAQELDENERLDVALVPAEEIVEFIRPDFHVHAIMVTALYWYTRYCEDSLSYDERVAKWEARQSNATAGPMH